MQTLRQSVSQAEAQLLTSPHPDRARLDAETLLLHLLQQNRAWLLAHWDDEISATNTAILNEWIARRKAGEPLQYILGKAEFFGLSFTVAPGVLIPRPETEHLVEEVLRLANDLSNPEIADIGTGSGAIAVALAHALPTARITATDLSDAALKIARQNAADNQVADRINFLEGDLLTPLAQQRFSIIASNPPYIPSLDHDSLSIEVRQHEPHSALFAGEDGLAIYKRLIPDARAQLLAGGWLVMEIGYGQQPAIEALLKASNYEEIHFIPDYQGILRVAVAQHN
ncbi:peptide chain release factor N(5)-glutamine methyltransferase [Acidicapsa ligni]|uniref:peptide chain release factor N(5)-glutamine methyltransferase n=1 Tax=Acidicapsa ligni TaxID=542300 RepID=UPI0021E07197|nr:peptide chain release factor N(5)-glutamine methyltransferase [Acidicapsa ligni]